MKSVMFPDEPGWTLNFPDEDNVFPNFSKKEEERMSSTIKGAQIRDETIETNDIKDGTLEGQDVNSTGSFTMGALGLGTSPTNYTLEVAGNAGFNEYLYHNSDADTFIRFEEDEINIKAGGVAMILAVEGSGGDQADKVTINDDQADVDFQVKGDGVANLLRTDAANDRVGIGTDTPTYTLDVAGDVGFNEYIYHNGDTDTFIRLQEDEINIKAGNINFINITEATQDKITFNDGWRRC